jgi:2,3-bisphosphoglycerate-independent phosphoglycerate mutase
VELAYLAIVSGDAPKFSSAEELIAKSYKDQITDEFIQPHVHINYKGIEQGDSVMIMNFRADRVRQLAAALCDPDFDGFARDVLQLSCIVSMTEYDEHLDPYLQVMLPAEIPAQTLGQIVSERGLKQVRIAETEKYAHVTYFFNGGIEEPFTNEDRILIQSPRVKTYDLEPQMSCFKVAQEVIEVVKKGFHQFVCVNFANPDMVGHTGNLKATIAAIESVDKCLGQIVAVAKQFGYDLLITADHGNAECMHDEVSHQPLTSHTLNKVPLIYYGSNNIKLKDGGLANIAATVLSLLGMSKPEQMCEGLDLK